MSNDSNMQWGIERRLEFIDYLLYWDGKVNRRDIIETFGVSTPQASADIKRYQELAPHNLEYDKSKKYYFAPASFSPKFMKPDAEQYLSQLLNAQQNPESLIIEAPAYATLPNIRRTIDTGILKHIVRAIRDKQAIEIKYQSFSKPNPSWRWISPHALGFADKRWHCRAYCDNHQDFRDFVLSRILEVRHKKPAFLNPQDDKEWQTEVTLELSPNPNLSEEQQKAIARDYGMQNARLQIPTKVALVHYFLYEYGLETDQIGEKQEIVLLNRVEIQAMQQQLRPTP
jgi:predicted DNA-binding transcriptional regulator YafY